MALADPLPAAQKIAGPDEVTTHRLYIGGLAENVTRDELEQRFKSFGKIVSTELLNDKLTGKPRGFGYVSLEASEKSVSKCMTALNGAKWKGQALRIQKAKESFLSKLDQERKEREDQRREDEQKAALAQGEPRVMTTKVAKRAEGWRVAQNGRAVAVVRVQDPRRRRVITVDPSKDLMKRLRRFPDRGEPVDRKRVLEFLLADVPKAHARPATNTKSAHRLPSSASEEESDSEPEMPNGRGAAASEEESDSEPEMPNGRGAVASEEDLDSEPEMPNGRGAGVDTESESEADGWEGEGVSANEADDTDGSGADSSEPELARGSDSEVGSESDSEPSPVDRLPVKPGRGAGEAADVDVSLASGASARASQAGESLAKKKGVSDDERRALANERRLQTLKELAEQRAKRAIKIDPDARGPQTNKIRFDDDSDAAPDDAAPATESSAKRSLLSGSDDDDEAASEPDGPTGKNAQDWLGLSGDDSDNDADRFQVKEVFQGEKGQKLLELSRRFKGDDRFKLDSRFIDDGEDERVGADGDKHDDLAPAVSAEESVRRQLQEEKNRNLQIMAALLGKDPEQLKPKDKDQEGANRDAGKKRSAPQGFGQVHYDPTSEDAARFELQKDAEAAVDVKKRKVDGADEEPSSREETPEPAAAPQVSKDKFFDVDLGTVSTLFHRRKTEDAPAPKYESFSLMGMLGGDDSAGHDNEGGQERGFTFLKDDASEDEGDSTEDDMDGDHSDDAAVAGSSVASTTTTNLAGAGAAAQGGARRMFFFHMDDPKLANRLVMKPAENAGDGADGQAVPQYPQYFMRTETVEELTERWKANREKLTKEFKSKHKTNVKRNRRTKEKGQLTAG